MAAKKREQQVNSMISTVKCLTNKKLAGNGPSRFVVCFIRLVSYGRTSANILFLPLPDRSEYVFADSTCLRKIIDSECRSTPPLWRSSSSGSRKVVGASYSHADVLKFDSLYAKSHILPIGHC